MERAGEVREEGGKGHLLNTCCMFDTLCYLKISNDCDECYFYS